MYYTLKIRMIINERQKDILQEYENIYHEQLNRMIHYMNVTGNVMMKNMMFTKVIVKQNEWQLYRIALKYYQTLRCKGNYHYGRSSTWSQGAYIFKEQYLILMFGSKFQVNELRIRLSMNEKEIKLLNLGKISRLDIVHDEKFWFVNFTCQS